MSKQDVPNPSRRSFFTRLAKGLEGFSQGFYEGLHPTEELAQELADIEAELDEVQAIVEQQAQDQQAVLEVVQRMEGRQELVLERMEMLERAGRTEERDRWQAVLRRLRALLLLLVGATAGAAYELLVQEEMLPWLLRLIKRSEPVMGPVETPLPALPAPETPSPAPSPSPTPTPVQVVDPTSTPEAAEQALDLGKGRLRFDWVTIPAGWFWMGSDDRRDEQPLHQVYLPRYRIARTPVTVAQFAAFVRATGYKTTVEKPGSNYTWRQPRGAGSGVRGKAQHPVSHMTWHDAQAFCGWAGVRLPTEAEWEKAARGVAGRIWPWGDEPPNAELCNFAGNVGGTTPVGKYPDGASPYGVLDMAGNVWEWTSSLYKPYPYDSADGREDQEASGLRVVRGGSGYSSSPTSVRCAARNGNYPRSGLDDCGFRVARGPLK